MKKKHRLYLCTIFPERPLTIEMGFNYHILQRSKRLEIIPVFVEAGTFSHRHKRHEADPDQILLRQRYLDEVPEGEWLLIMDTDEVLLCPPDNIADMIDYLEANAMEVGMCVEIRPDQEAKGRPRLIKKKDNLRYGGPRQKHDVIWTCDHEGATADTTGEECVVQIDNESRVLTDITCMDGYNYIDVNNTDTAMDIPLLFYHFKDTDTMSFTTPKGYDLKHPDWVIQKEVEV